MEELGSDLDVVLELWTDGKEAIHCARFSEELCLDNQAARPGMP